MPSCNTHLSIKRVAAQHQLQEAHGDREQLGAQARPCNCNLLCRVVRGAGADVRGKNRYLLLDAEAKVGENPFSVLGHEDVFWLDVPVEKPDGAKEVDRSEDASEYPDNSAQQEQRDSRRGGGEMVQPQRRPVHVRQGNKQTKNDEYGGRTLATDGYNGSRGAPCFSCDQRLCLRWHRTCLPRFRSGITRAG